MNAAFATSTATLIAACLLAGCAPPRTPDAAPLQSEAASGTTEKSGHASRSFSVAAANPLATEAGYEILKAGGSAVDAAIAVQMVLTLAEPQSSGIGGGALLLHFRGRGTGPAADRIAAYDGRETAPAGVDDKLFLRPDGTPMGFFEAAVGGRAVGVPGVVPMLALAHKQHGKLPWARLFAPAIRLADAGFEVSPRLHSLLLAETHLRRNPVAAAYFYNPQGQPWPVGHRLKNPELAAVLRRVAAEGPRALQRGAIAQAMVRAVRSHRDNPGALALADLAGYQPRQRPPLCTDHDAPARALRICGMPPPSSGAITIAQILGMLRHTPAAGLPLDKGLPSADWLHYYTEAARLAYADRAQYLADPDFVPPPAGGYAALVAPAYLAERAKLIGPRSMASAPAGTPGAQPLAYAPMPAQPEYGTSHISVADPFGNVIAMTTTIENAFGARLMVNRGVGLAGGFLLNNELTDFSFAPAGADGRPIANRVQPGKRPRSSMAPTLVFERLPDGHTGALLMTLGSPGGGLIIHFTAKTLYATQHWGLNVQQAISLPNFATLGGPLLLEEGSYPAATVAALAARGHSVRSMALTSGLQAIEKIPQGWFGGADPRREGIVLGD